MSLEKTPGSSPPTPLCARAEERSHEPTVTMANSTLKGELLPDINCAGTLVLNSQSPEPCENKFLLFLLPNLCYFVVEALVD